MDTTNDTVHKIHCILQIGISIMYCTSLRFTRIRRFPELKLTWLVPNLLVLRADF